MPKLAIVLTTEQKSILQQNGIDIAQFLRDTLKAKMNDMVRVAENDIDNIPGRVKYKVETASEDISDSHRDKLKELKIAGKLDFIDFTKGKFKQSIKAILKGNIEADSASITITPKQEAFLLCNMANPKGWINNAIRVKVNKLKEGA